MARNEIVLPICLDLYRSLVSDPDVSYRFLYLVHELHRRLQPLCSRLELLHLQSFKETHRKFAQPALDERGHTKYIVCWSELLSVEFRLHLLHF
jgi:hypothetical protein